MGNRIKSRVSTIMAAMSVMALMALPAFAAPPEIETVIDGAFTDVTGLLTGTVIVAFFAITLVVLGAVVGWKWLRRGVKQG